MEASERDNDGSDEERVKAAWATPVLIAVGSMMNVLADEGFGGDGTGTGSQFSS
jgi:hypothetical protein